MATGEGWRWRENGDGEDDDEDANEDDAGSNRHGKQHSHRRSVAASTSLQHIKPTSHISKFTSHLRIIHLAIKQKQHSPSLVSITT